MSLTNFKYISAEDCLGESRVTINDNFKTFVDEISALQEITVIAYPKGTRGTLRIGDGLTIDLNGNTSVDFDVEYFALTTEKKLTLTETFLDNTFVKKTGDVMSGPLTLEGANGNVGIGTPATTDYNLNVAGFTNFQSTVYLPTAPGTSPSQILNGTGEGASYNTYNTAICVSKGLAIKSSEVTIVFNSQTGDILSKGSLTANKIVTSHIQNDSTDTKLALNNSLFIDSAGNINLSGVTITSSPPLSTDRSNRIATTNFVHNNLDVVKNDLQNANTELNTLSSSLELCVRKRGDIISGDLWVPDPVNLDSAVNKQYVDTAVNNLAGNICNKVEILDLLSDLLTLKIDTQPTNATVNEPLTNRFVVHAIPDSISFLPISYQWRKDGVNILNATSSTLTVGESGTYTCVCSNPISVVTSNSAVLSVNRRVLITTEPVSQTLTPSNQQTVLTVGVVGTSPFYYQWQKNNSNIPGATSSSLTVTKGGRYKCVINNMVNSAWSKDAFINNQINVDVFTTYSSIISISNRLLATASHGQNGDSGTLTYTNLYSLFGDNYKPTSVVLYGDGGQTVGYINGNQVLYTGNNSTGTFRVTASISPTSNGSFTYRAVDNGWGGGAMNVYLEGFTRVDHAGSATITITSLFNTGYNITVNGTTKACPVNTATTITPLPAGTYPLLIQDTNNSIQASINITIPNGSGTTSLQQDVILTS